MVILHSLNLKRWLRNLAQKSCFAGRLWALPEGLKDIHRFEFRQGMIVKVNSFSGLQVDEVYETNYSNIKEI